MLIRIVRMTIHPENVDRFEELFRGVHRRIESFPGCHNVELARDARYPNVLVTISRWNNEKALESYRSSDLFRRTWSETRELFAAAPEATSYHPVGLSTETQSDSERAPGSG